jgi:hypothetical protein
MAEFHFRSMEASQIKCDVTIQFLVGGLVIHFAGISHLFVSVQKLQAESSVILHCTTVHAVIIAIHCCAVMRHTELVYSPASHNALRARLARFLGTKRSLVSCFLDSLMPATGRKPEC